MPLLFLKHSALRTLKGWTTLGHLTGNRDVQRARVISCTFLFRYSPIGLSQGASRPVCWPGHSVETSLCLQGLSLALPAGGSLSWDGSTDLNNIGDLSTEHIGKLGCVYFTQAGFYSRQLEAGGGRALYSSE